MTIEDNDATTVSIAATDAAASETPTDPASSRSRWPAARLRGRAA